MEFIKIMPSSISISNENIKRDIIRPVEFCDTKYENEYDFKTIFYDIFFDESVNNIICVGPPFLNFINILDNTNFYIYSDNLNYKPCKKQYINLKKCSIMILYNDCKYASNILYYEGKIGKGEIKIGINYTDIFENKNILITLQKNNKLQWIIDWININIALHSINSIIIFDNASSSYNIYDMVLYIKNNIIKNIDILCIVEMPFLYGPQGGEYNKWDSDFLQYCCLEIAHRRFLSKSHIVINNDVDEITICDNDKSLIDTCCTERAISYYGLWIDFSYNHTNIFKSDFFNIPLISIYGKCPKKWSIMPSAIVNDFQLLVHKIISNNNLEISNTVDKIFYRHFRNITTNWKYNRTKNIDYDSNSYILDCNLIKIFNKELNKFDSMQYPVDDIIKYAKSIGACPRKSDYLNLFGNCSICPFNH